MGILTNGPHAVDGAIGEIITGQECKTLHGLLKLLRSERDPAWLSYFLRKLAAYADLYVDVAADPQIVIKDVLGSIVDSINETDSAMDVEAIMYQRDENTFTMLTPDEHQELLSYLGVERSGSWFGGFVASECCAFATHKDRTPEQVIRSLVGNELEEFDCNVETTRKMLENHPDQFQAEIERLAPKPAEPEKPPQAAPKEPRRGEPTRWQLTMVEHAEVKEPANLTRAEFQALQKHLATIRARKTGKGKKKAA